MPKGRGANDRRRGARQRGHLVDDARIEADIDAMGRGAVKLQKLYDRAAALARSKRRRGH